MVTRINMALQGGGAHGAFTWGVLDRLLEDKDLAIAGVSGTSAGALNGAALKAGLIADGVTGARASLDKLWADVARLTDFRLSAWMQPIFPGIQEWNRQMQELLPVSTQGIAAQMFSPYSWGPAWKNPLEPVVRHLDFSRVCAIGGFRLFVGATNVRTGRSRIFEGEEITPKALMASACLPTVFQAVEIEGETYWDGGYSGNPALYPLYRPGLADDIIIVSINPLLRDEVPKTPIDIQNRVNEISFNSALLGELRAINFVRRLIGEGRIEKGQMRQVNVHLISDDDLMTSLSATTKLSPSPALFDRLKQAGRAAADRFLTEHRAKLTHESSFDLQALFG